MQTQEQRNTFNYDPTLIEGIEGGWLLSELCIAEL
jgi:hypothetical protein